MRRVIEMINNEFKCKKQILFFISGILLLLNGCAAVNTFPMIARAGDTVSVMVGGAEKARKETIAVTLTDTNGQNWDLQALGLVRSVFNLRADGRSKGTHYASYLENNLSWSFGHEAMQTILIADLPSAVPPGHAYLSINSNVDDDSSGFFSQISVNVEIIPGSGSRDYFVRQNSVGGNQVADFNKLEPASHGKISFGDSGGVVLGAASLVVDFDESVVNPDDINVYVPESTVRGSIGVTGSFGEGQRMVYWHQDGLQLFIDVVAPQGIDQSYLKMYLIHPDGLSGSPGFSLTSSKVYDVNGSEIILPPTLEYFP